MVVVLPDIGSEVKDNCLTIDFLLPNGILIPIPINFYKPFEIIKQDVWKEAENYPLFYQLKRSDSYCFVCLNKQGEREEILDESQCLSDIRPYSTFLKLVERVGDERHKTLVRNINTLIGKDPQKVEAWQSAEVADFRTTMRQMCDRIVQERTQQGWYQALLYRFPPRLRPSEKLPSKIEERLPNHVIMMEVIIEDTQIKYTMQITGDNPPAVLINNVLQKLQRSGQRAQQDASQYLLKSYGTEEYIYGEQHPLQQYKYVYQCLVKNKAPQFVLVLRENAIGTDIRPAVPPRRPSTISVNSANIPSRAEKEICVWDVKEKYYFNIRGVNKVQLADQSKVKLFMGLYHGSEALCGLKTSDDVFVTGGECNMKMDVVFDIAAQDIPQMARLCLTLCAAGKKKEYTAVCWVNVAVFDFRSRLMRGDRDLPMWPWTDELQSEEFCYPIGSVAPNPQASEATTLLIRFPDFNQKSNILYPAYDKVLECAAKNMEPSGKPGSVMFKASRSHQDQLKIIIARDSLLPLFEQDKELLWMMRHECCHNYPCALPKVLSSVKWMSHTDVAKMIALLKIWPRLQVDFALQLLDFNYPDKNVREFAVSCLEIKEFNDDDLSRYLLQLVQALKYETHLCNPLVKFLLTRALGNQHIGHQLFWLLKSELHNPYVSVQYRLILEVYLLCSSDHMMALHKEQEALGKLCTVNDLIKNMNITEPKSHDQAQAHMHDVLRQRSYLDTLCDLSSPLSPLFKLKDLDIAECRFMKSKKRPLWLVWKNEMGSDISLIYKNGDDLRQDMLTLQMLEIMDNIWQAEGLDLRMNVYRCLATGHEQGVIEAVSEAWTIAKIQKWFNKGAFDKKAVFEWLKTKHPTPEALDDAVEEFMLSCAGYCVATYVLGIGDRHNDNIMLTHSGQLFHIDFGHFLGNFKSKFGVKRERVPFVLTTHFVYVIQKGNAKKQNFNKFKEYCERAYLILRRKSSLLFSLFLMMLSSGIPQLTCVKDVDYLRDTLQPDLSEHDACEHFRKKMVNALEKSWTTSVNFYVHLKANK